MPDIYNLPRNFERKERTPCSHHYRLVVPKNPPAATAAITAYICSVISRLSVEENVRYCSAILIGGEVVRSTQRTQPSQIHRPRHLWG